MSDTYADLGGALSRDPDAPNGCSWRCDGTGYDRYGTIGGRKVPVSCRPTHKTNERHRPRLTLVRG
jgi:hypothetical protein